MPLIAHSNSISRNIGLSKELYCMKNGGNALVVGGGHDRWYQCRMWIRSEVLREVSGSRHKGRRAWCPVTFIAVWMAGDRGWVLGAAVKMAVRGIMSVSVMKSLCRRAARFRAPRPCVPHHSIIIITTLTVSVSLFEPHVLLILSHISIFSYITFPLCMSFSQPHVLLILSHITWVILHSPPLWVYFNYVYFSFSHIFLEVYHISRLYKYISATGVAHPLLYSLFYTHESYSW